MNEPLRIIDYITLGGRIHAKSETEKELETLCNLCDFGRYYSILYLQIFISIKQKYLIMIANLALIYIIAVSGLDILFGYCGQISFGHAAFYAIGAYISGILYNELSMPAIPAILISSLVAATTGALLALPASKLKFHFLSLATVAFGEIVYQIIFPFSRRYYR